MGKVCGISLIKAFIFIVTCVYFGGALGSSFATLESGSHGNGY